MISSPESVTELAKYAVFVLSYGVLGGALKYIDQAFDASVFSKKIATLLAFPTALLMGFLMVMDSYSATIFLAIVLAVGVTHKIDTIAFRLGVFILILVPVFFRQLVEIQWLPFGLLVLAGIVDEFSNDWADRMLNGKSNHGKKGFLSWVFAKLFLQRPLLKLCVFALSLTGFFHIIYFIAFFAFDTMYSLVAWISMRYKVYKISAVPLANTNQVTVNGRRNLATI